MRVESPADRSTGGIPVRPPLRTHGRDRRRSALSGDRLRERSDVLEALDEIGEETWSNSRGPLVIEGGPGLGKTALIHASCKIASDKGLTVMWARCSPQERHRPYGLARELLLPIVHAAAPSSSPESAVLGALRSGSLPAGDDHVIFSELTSLVAAAGPSLLAVDDVNFADAESMSWLPFLSHHLCDMGANLVLSTAPRPGGTPLTAIDRLSLGTSARIMPLHPLHETSIADIVAERLGDSADSTLVASIGRVTGGNPFLLIAALNQLLANATTFQPADLDDMISSAVDRRLLHWVSALPPRSINVIQALALLGAHSSLQIVADVAEMDAAEADLLADGLADVGILRTSRPLEFVYPLVASSVYGQLSASMRSRHHAIAARSLKASHAPAERTAGHLLRTEPADQPWVIGALAEAAREALDANDTDSACTYLDRADREMSFGIDRADLHLLRAEVEARLGNSVAVEHLRNAELLDHDSSELGRTGIRVTQSLWNTGYGPEIVDLMIANGGMNGSEPLLRLQIALFGAVLRPSSSAALALSSVIEEAALQTPSHGSAALQAARMYVAVAAATGTSQTGMAALLDMDAVLFAQCEPDVVGCAATDIAIQALTLLARAGAFATTDPLIRAVQRQLLASSRYDEHAAVSILLADSLQSQGRLEQAERELLHIGAHAPLPDGWIRDQAVLARHEFAALRSGVATVPVPPGAEWHAAPGLVNGTSLAEGLGRLNVAAGNWSQALEHFSEASVLANERGLLSPAASGWRVGTCEALRGNGQIQAAAELASENLELARRVNLPVTLAAALRQSAHQPGADRVALLEEALSVVTGTGAELEHCRVLIDYGTALRATNIDHARTQLREGADVAARMGAGALVSRARDELLAAGARPRHLVLSGYESLTPSERRVVALAASGCTNAVISQRLFVSIKTVESHLSRSYRKLNVSSRDELGRILDSAEVDVNARDDELPDDGDNGSS